MQVVAKPCQHQQSCAVPQQAASAAGREGFSCTALTCHYCSLQKLGFHYRDTFGTQGSPCAQLQQGWNCCCVRQCLELHHQSTPLSLNPLPGCHPQSQCFRELLFPTLGLTLNGNVLALCGSFGFCRSTLEAILSPDPRNELS